MPPARFPVPTLGPFSLLKEAQTLRPFSLPDSLLDHPPFTPPFISPLLKLNDYCCNSRHSLMARLLGSESPPPPASDSRPSSSSSSSSSSFKLCSPPLRGPLVPRSSPYLSFFPRCDFLPQIVEISQIFEFLFCFLFRFYCDSDTKIRRFNGPAPKSESLWTRAGPDRIRISVPTPQKREASSDGRALA